MGAITGPNLVQFTDYLTSAMLRIKGTVGGDYGTGDPTLAIGSDWGESKRLRNMMTVLIGDGSTVYGIADSDVVSGLVTSFQRAATAADWRTRARDDLGQPVLALNQLARAAGSVLGVSTITDLQSFLQYYNYGAGSLTANRWKHLVAPDFRDLYNLVMNATLDAKVVYSPAIASMATLTQAGTFTDVAAVDTTKYAGVGRLVLSTNSGMDITGSATIRITGNGYDASGNAVTARTWDAVVNADGTAEYTPTPTNSGDILTDVTGMALQAGTWVAGTVTVKCYEPSANPYSSRIVPPV